MFRGFIHCLRSFLSFGLVDVVVSWCWQQHMLHRSLTDGDGGYIWQRLVHSNTPRKGRQSDPRECLALCLTKGKYKPAYLSLMEILSHQVTRPQQATFVRIICIQYGSKNLLPGGFVPITLVWCICASDIITTGVCRVTKGISGGIYIFSNKDSYNTER